MDKIFKNKTVLITGGTGFLGRALTEEILKFNPKSIRIFSRDEFKHFQISEKFNNKKIRNFVGDVRDYERLKKATQNCDILIHAAALKRIDMIEYNVEESIKTNILGTLNVIRACLENNVSKVIFISTDKACAPINTYGACKFVSERIFTESNFSKGLSKTTFTCVRYGNVINSTGSVIPFFIEKIKKGEEIPLTHAEMTRFLITSRQAVNLVFDAIKYGVGGEVFVPKLPSFKILNLINFLKESYSSNSKIKITGIRPGEKIHELMVNESEADRTFEFRNRLIITDQLREKYVGEGYFYLKNCKKFNSKEYSSKDSVLEGKELSDYFKKIGLLN